MGVITYCPDHGQTQEFLVGVGQSSLHIIYNSENIHEVIMNFLKKSLNDCLERLQIIRAFYYRQYASPTIGHDMAIVNDQLVHSDHQLILNLLELTAH